MNACKPFIPTLFLLALLLGNPQSVEGKHGNFPASAAVPRISCEPELQGRHLSLYYPDEIPAARLTAPRLTKGCSPVKQLDYDERLIDLGCQNNGFTGYFSPSEWVVSKIYGDGGVDVTGAPNALSVEGADNALVNVLSGGKTRMQILVPTDGMIAFGWRNVGGSNLFSEEFRILINDREYVPIRHAQSRGRFRCPVRSGDLLKLEFSPRQSALVAIDRFRLLTNVRTVIRRHWTATDERGQTGEFTQFISIEQPSISDIIVPASVHDMPVSPASAQPSVTGFPYIDRDGNISTTADRYYLTGDTGQFAVDYSDSLQQTPQGTFVYRHWTIRDTCGGNTMKEIQVIRLLSDPASEYHREDNLYRWLEKETYEQLASPAYHSEIFPGLSSDQELQTL